jgi:DNA (cytosine-5)-methyltransferase 1
MWSDYETITFGDGKTRRAKPGLAPLVDGTPARVVRLRGYGNAIVPDLAAKFVAAYLEARVMVPA